MTLIGRLQSFEVVDGALEAVFSGDLSHSSGNGSPPEQHWGFSARVNHLKLVVGKPSALYFFTTDEKGGTQTRNFGTDLELARDVYAKGHLVWISCYGPQIHFEAGISKIVASSATISILTDTMSNTKSKLE